MVITICKKGEPARLVRITVADVDGVVLDTVRAEIPVAMRHIAINFSIVADVRSHADLDIGMGETNYPAKGN